MNNIVALFGEKEIRKVYKNNKWYYSIQDVISLLTEDNNPSEHLKKIKQKDIELQNNWNSICIMLNMQTKDGKIRKTQTADTIGILRIIESIQSSKTEPIKKWLARLGYERLEEINNPELAMDRMKQIYELKGYSPLWIEQREREITTRHSLKEEWKNRGAQLDRDYIILKNEIYQNSFDISSEEYQKIKGIQDIGCLKDSMTNLELALINLNEVASIEMHKKNNSRGMKELKQDLDAVGKVIKNTKQEIENNLEKSIISSENYMNLTHNDK